MTIVITSTVAGDAEGAADLALHVSQGSVEIGGAVIESVVAELALLEALVVGIAMRDLPRTLSTLQLVADAQQDS